MFKIITHSENETVELGKRLAANLRGGEVIAFFGNLGSGKTTLIKGIARGLGVKNIITSPTFILMNVYKTPPPSPPYKGGDRGGRIRKFVHIDCYRIRKAQEIIDIGALEYFGRIDTVVAIEWAEKIKKILPKKRIDIKIKSLQKDKRIFFVLRQH